jgi:hypothetical protein
VWLANETDANSTNPRIESRPFMGWSTGLAIQAMGIRRNLSFEAAVQLAQLGYNASYTFTLTDSTGTQRDSSLELTTQVGYVQLPFLFLIHSNLEKRLSLIGQVGFQVGLLNRARSQSGSAELPDTLATANQFVRDQFATTDVSLIGGLGIRYRLSDQWSLDAALRTSWSLLDAEDARLKANDRSPARWVTAGLSLGLTCSIGRNNGSNGNNADTNQRTVNRIELMGMIGPGWLLNRDDSRPAQQPAATRNHNLNSGGAYVGWLQDIGNHLHVRAGVGLAVQGGSFEYSYTDSTPSNAVTERTISLSYLQVPLGIGYHTILGGSFRLELDLGLAPSFLLQARQTISDTVLTYPNNLRTSDFYTAYDLQAFGRAGVRWDVSNRLGVYSGLQGSLSLLDIENTEYKPVGRAATRAIAAQFVIGLAVRFGSVSSLSPASGDNP